MFSEYLTIIKWGDVEWLLCQNLIFKTFFFSFSIWIHWNVWMNCLHTLIKKTSCALKGRGHDCGQFFFFYFYCLQYFSNAFLMINHDFECQSLWARYRSHNSLIWKQGLCHVFVYVGLIYRKGSSIFVSANPFWI